MASNSTAVVPRVLQEGPLVGAYYYPWHYDDFHHNIDYLRRQLIPRQEPLLGEYNDREVSTIRQHVNWCLSYNINLWVTSWRGKGRREDVTTRIIMDYLEEESETNDFRISILYETKARVKDEDTSKVKNDAEYIAKRFFERPNYLRVNDQPVLFIYVTRVLEKKGLLNEVITLMREGAAEAGYDNIYIVGDQAYKAPPKNEQQALDLLDAVTNYDVFGSLGRPRYAGESGVEKYREEQDGWKQAAGKQDCGFIPSVTPGFNAISKSYGPMSRRLSKDDEEGSLFAALLEDAMKLIDEDVNMIMITSFNEWHEDTQIEPLKKSNNGSTEVPEDITYGIEYEAYQMEYLELVKQYTLN